MTAPRLRKTRCARYGANRCSAEYRVGAWRFWKLRDNLTVWIGQSGSTRICFAGFRQVRKFARNAPL